MTIALLVAYACLLLWAGLNNGKQTPEDFFLNKRSSTAAGVGLSIVVSSVGASATIGMVGLAFGVGTPAFWWLGAGCFGLTMLAFFLAKKVRKTNAYTLPHLVEKLLGTKARFLSAFIIVVAWLAILAAQFSAIATLFNSLLGVNAYFSLSLGFAFIVLHSLGGQRTIIKLDRVQAIIILISLIIVLAYLAKLSPGWFGQVKVEAVNSRFSSEQLLYYIIVVGANYLVCPTLFSRVLSAKDEKAASRGVLLGVGGLFVAACLIVAIGLAARGLIPADTPQDAVLSAIFADVLPPELFLLGTLALLAAIISSADTALLVAGTVFSFDILRKTEPQITRRCTLILGVAGALLSLWGKGILGFLLMAFDLFACGVVMPVFVALLWAEKRVVRPQMGSLAIIFGGIIGVYGAVSGDVSYIYVALFLAGLITYLGFSKEEHNASEKFAHNEV